MSDERTVISEERVRDAMRPDRPDADAFRAEVERKLRERQAERPAGESDVVPMQQATWWSKVAALAPVAGAAKSSPLGKSFFGALALPVFGLVLMVASFVASSRRLSPSDGEPDVTERGMRRALAEWRRRHVWKYVAAVVGIVLVGIWYPSTAIAIGLSAYMLSFACFVGYLSAAKLAERRVIASLVVSSLLPVGLFSYQISMWMPGHEDGLFDLRWITVILLGGAAVCGVIGIPGRARRIFWFCFLALYIAPHAIVSIDSGRPSVLEIQEYAESFDSARYSHASWEPMVLAAERGLELGMEPDWSKPRALFERTAVTDKGRVDGAVAGPVMRLGIPTPQHVDELLATESSRRDVANLLDPDDRDQKILWFQQEEWVIRALATADRLRDEDRDVLASRLLASWPDDDEEYGHLEALEKIHDIVTLLDLIERPIDVDAWRSEVFSWLEKRQVRVRRLLVRSGGFDSHGDVPDYSDVEETYAAVRLMARFGVPDGVELERVRSFLLYEAKPLSSLLGITLTPRWVASAALDVYEAELARPRTWLQAILGERLLIGAALLVGFCLFAVLRAPKGKVHLGWSS